MTPALCIKWLHVSGINVVVNFLTHKLCVSLSRLIRVVDIFNFVDSLLVHVLRESESFIYSVLITTQAHYVKLGMMFVLCYYLCDI